MADGARDCALILSQTATAVAPLIRAQVDRLPREIRHACGLHFGWWTDQGQALDRPGTGKSVRPALALLASRAVGGDPQAARPVAVAVELVHNASLLHDDIIDHDPVRRGRPALWSAKGVPAAILAGDALFFAAVQALCAAPHAERTVPVLLRAVQDLIEGEYIDTLLESGVGVSQDRALAAAAGKTAALLACACELGAIAGGAGPERAGHLHEFGRHLGLAFQCADDLLGIWGDERATGKPALSDVRRRKASLPVAAAMTAGTPQSLALRALYGQDGPLGDDHCRRAVELLEECGAREDTQRRAHRHRAEALRHLELAALDPVAARELTDLADLVVNRDR